MTAPGPASPKRAPHPEPRPPKQPEEDDAEDWEDDTWDAEDDTWDAEDDTDDPDEDDGYPDVHDDRPKLSKRDMDLLVEAIVARARQQGERRERRTREPLPLEDYATDEDPEPRRRNRAQRWDPPIAAAAPKRPGSAPGQRDAPTPVAIRDTETRGRVTAAPVRTPTDPGAPARQSAPPATAPASPATTPAPKPPKRGKGTPPERPAPRARRPFPTATLIQGYILASVTVVTAGLVVLAGWAVWAIVQSIL